MAAPIGNFSLSDNNKLCLRDLVVHCFPQDPQDPESEGITIKLIEDRYANSVSLFRRSSSTTWLYPRNIILNPIVEDLTFIAQSREGNDLAILLVSREELANYAEIALLEPKEEREFICVGTCPRLKLIFSITTLEILESRILGLFDTIPDPTLYLRELQRASDEPQSLALYGSLYFDRFLNTRNRNDLDRCIIAYNLAVQQADSDDPKYADYVYDTAMAVYERFKLNNEQSDLNRAISMLEEAVSVVPATHRKMVEALNNLGIWHRKRYHLEGNVQDISAAISHFQRLIELTPHDDPYMLSRAAGLTSAYLLRSLHTGEVEDRLSAVSIIQKAIRTSPAASGDPEMRNFLSSFGTFMTVGFGSDTIDNSSTTAEMAKTLCKFVADHPNSSTPSYDSYPIDMQAAPLILGFEGTKDLGDISIAISHCEAALERCSNNPRIMSALHYTLGASFFTRADPTNNLDDFSLAILHSNEAIDLTPEDDPEMFSRRFHLGMIYERYFAHTNNTEALRSAMSTYRSVANASGLPSMRLDCAVRWASVSYHIDQEQCLVAYGVAISLLTQLAGMDQTLARRFAKLEKKSDFTKTAILVAFRWEEEEVALEWLEQGRCLVWNQLNQLRSSVDLLRTHHPSLADRFVEVSSNLESLGSRSMVTSTSWVDATAPISEMIVTEASGQKQFQMAREWNKLLEEIRDIPGFEEFLQPRKASSLLANLPPDGVVVIVNVEEKWCDALALIAGVDIPLHIPLKQFDYDKALKLRKHLRNYLYNNGLRARQEDRGTRRIDHIGEGVSMSQILRVLWTDVVKPILDALAYSSVSDPLRRRRVWWCPTGPLAFLPLHAAGIYGKDRIPGSCLSDFVVSSYTPTISTLLDKNRETSTKDEPCELLLISQPNTPGLPRIPATKEETQDLKEMMDQNNVKSILLEGSEATVSRVTEEMHSHSWIHFACHAVQDTDDVLHSGIHLHDGSLELADVTQLKIKKAEHAFLSACQTSAGHEKLSEEVVHLASGMIAAGYRSVVATMWSIQDMYGPQIARDFYGYLLEKKLGDTVGEGLESRSSAYALDFATRRIRDELGNSDDSFLTWVPYVHFGI